MLPDLCPETVIFKISNISRMDFIDDHRSLLLIVLTNLPLPNCDGGSAGYLRAHQDVIVSPNTQIICP